MIIKSISLKNFRQFVGENSIEFSIDPERRVSLIIAENTTGKTTLLESFSWCFYGYSNLKSIINAKLEKELLINNTLDVSVEVQLTHLSKQYLVKRTKIFKKYSKNSLVSEKEDFSISTIKDGIISRINDDFDKVMNEIVPRDLFSYFFFKGENIEKIGKEISKGKSNKNGEFVNAIRGLMGFNFLYESVEHLSKVKMDFSKSILQSNSDSELSRIINEINAKEDKIKDNNYKIKILQGELNINESIRDKYQQDLIDNGLNERNQKDFREKNNKRNAIVNSLNENKKKIFTFFSSNFPLLLIDRLNENIDSIIADNDILTKGIPGIEVKAIDYLLHNEQCLCGCKLIPGTTEFKKLHDLLEFLPPNNIGYEIKSFTDVQKAYSRNHDSIIETLNDYRRQINSDMHELDSLDRDIDELRSKIDNTINVQEIRANYEKYNELCFSQNASIQNLNRDNIILEGEISKLTKDKDSYRIISERNSIAMRNVFITDKIINDIKVYCKSHEEVKKREFENAINEIFGSIFNINLKINLGYNYEIELSSNDETSLSNFENSTSQDSILTFSFIAGIIKLAKDNIDNTKDDEYDDIQEELVSEPYPLVMDAPSSSFDKKRIENFCKIMPKIAEQVIVFIKDTDGEHFEKFLSNEIGKKYRMVKVDNFETNFEVFAND